MTSVRKQSAHRLSHDVGHALAIHAGAHEGATDLQHSELTGHQFGIVGGLTTTEIAAAFLVPGATMAAPGPMVTLSRLSRWPWCTGRRPASRCLAPSGPALLAPCHGEVGLPRRYVRARDTIGT